MRTLAVVPARSGSKRIPAKNMREFCGAPLLSYPLAAARDSGLFDEIHVSTDSLEIARFAAEQGLEPTFLRPSQLSDDFTTVLDVIAWVDEEFQRRGEHFDVVCLIYATAVFLSPSYLRESHELFRRSGYESPVMSVSTYPVPVEWALRPISGGLIEPQDKTAVLRRSQDMVPAFYECAMFIWLPVSRVRAASGVSIFPCLPHEVRREHAIDIDTPDDWQQAERSYKLSMIVEG